MKNRLAIKRFVFGRSSIYIYMIDIVSRELPLYIYVHRLVKADFYIFAVDGLTTLLWLAVW